MTKTARRAAHIDVLGFFGAIAAHVSDPAAAYADATRLCAQTVGCEPGAVRAFLDSRHGRLFADDVALALARAGDFATAVRVVFDRWQSWRMDGRGRAAPSGPFLAGTIQACAVGG